MFLFFFFFFSTRREHTFKFKVLFFFSFFFANPSPGVRKVSSFKQKKQIKRMPMLLLPDLREPEKTHSNGETDLIRRARLLTAFRYFRRS